MGILETARKIHDSRPSGGANNINPGQGLLEVLSLKYIPPDPKDDQYGDVFVAEMEVIECEGYAGQLDSKGVEKPAGNKVGSAVSFLQKFKGKTAKVAGPNTKGFLLALLDETEESFLASTDETIKRLTADAGYKKDVEKLLNAKFEVSEWTDAHEFALMMANLCNEATNPCRGMLIRYSTFESRPTRESHLILTIPRWETVSQTQEEIAERRAKRGG